LHGHEKFAVDSGVGVRTGTFVHVSQIVRGIREPADASVDALRPVGAPDHVQGNFAQDAAVCVWALTCIRYGKLVIIVIGYDTLGTVETLKAIGALFVGDVAEATLKTVLTIALIIGLDSRLCMHIGKVETGPSILAQKRTVGLALVSVVTRWTRAILGERIVGVSDVPTTVPNTRPSIQAVRIRRACIGLTMSQRSENRRYKHRKQKGGKVHRWRNGNSVGLPSA